MVGIDRRSFVFIVSIVVVVAGIAGTGIAGNATNAQTNDTATPTSTSGPPVEEWNTTVEYWPDQSGFGLGMVEGHDGHTIVAGFAMVSGNLTAQHSDGTIAEINESGGIVQARQFGENKVGSTYDDDYFYDITTTPDGGYLAVGGTNAFDGPDDDVWIVKLNADLDKQWDRVFESDINETAITVAQNQHGGYVVAGYTRTGTSSADKNVFVYNVTEDGQVVDQHFYGGAGNEEVWEIIRVPAGYALAGWTESYGSGGTDAWFVLLDDDFNILDNIPVGDSGDEYAYAVERPGEYIIAGSDDGDAFAARVVDFLGVSWKQTYGEGTLYSIEENTSTGDLIAAGTKSTSTGSDYWLLRTGDDGTQQWEQTFGGGEADNGYAGAIQSDGYVIAGASKSYGGTDYDMWVVKAGSNDPPTASLRVSDTNPTVGDLVVFNGSGSSDPDGSITEYEWLVDGTTVATTSIPSDIHEFTSAGTHVVELRVTDDDGATATDSIILSVDDDNQAPNATFDWSPSDPIVGQNITFDATAADPDGTIDSYRWEFGTVALKTGNPVTHAFQSAGNYTVTLTVTDNDGASTTITRPVDVASTRFRVLDLSAPSSAAAGANITVEAMIANVGNVPETAVVSWGLDRTQDGTIGQFDPQQSKSVSINAGDSQRVRFDVSLPDGIDPDTYTHQVSTGDDTASTTIEITSGPAGVIEKYDADGDGQIDTAEFRDAITDWAVGALATPDLYTVGEAWATDGSSGQVAASRSIDTTDLAPGASTTVTTTLTGFTATDRVTLHESVGDDLSATSVDVTTSGDASVLTSNANSNGTFAAVSGLSDGETVTVTYTVTAASSATPGDSIPISGTATAPGGETVLGNDTITIGGGGSGASTEFLASDLSAPSTATPGETITVEAQIENVGNVAGTQAVDWRFDTDGDGTLEDSETVASRQVSLDAGEDRTVSFDATVPSVTAGDYDHGVFTANDSAVGTMSVTSGGSANLSVSRSLGSSTTSPGSSVTVTTTVELNVSVERLSITETFSPAFETATVGTVQVNGNGIIPTTATFQGDTGLVVLQNLDAGDTITVTYTVAPPSSAASGDTFDITGTVTAPNDTVSVGQDTITIGTGPNQYAGSDNRIQTAELRSAISDWVSGKIDTGLLRQVISAWVKQSQV